MNRVIIITNGNSKIGYGHISRTLVLAQEFKDVEVIFLVPIDCSFITDIKEQSYQVETVNTFQINDCRWILEYNPSIILIDTIEKEYDELNWLVTYREKILIVTITLFFFDINKRFEKLSFYPCMGISEKLDCESVYGEIEIYRGSKFFTFRKEFNSVGKIVRKLPETIIVSMGGTDPLGLTYIVTNSLVNISISITIILSKLSPCYSKVRDLVNIHSNFTLVEKERNIANKFKQADLILLNGGLTRYEACMVGTPFLALSIHKKQYEITEQVTMHGVGVNLGIYNQITSKKIRSEVLNLLSDYDKRRKMSEKMVNLFDNNGANRIVSIIKDRIV